VTRGTPYRERGFILKAPESRLWDSGWRLDDPLAPFVKLTLARMKERNIADIVVPWLSANAFNN
jgi:hypothetical protein